MDGNTSKASSGEYSKQIDGILSRLDQGQPSGPMLGRIEQRVTELFQAYEFDEGLGTDRFKLYVAQAMIHYYRGDERSAKALMEEAIRIKGNSFGFAEEFLSNLSVAPVPQLVPQRKRKTTGARGVLMLLMIVVGIIIFAISNLGPSGSTPYQATTTGFTVISPSTVSVSIRITNNGSKSGTPNCMLKAEDSANINYQGFDYISPTSTVSPGQTINSADSLTISNQGAQYVNQTSISCN